MFAIAFDLTLADTEVHHPKGYQAAYADIARSLGKHGFERIQGSVYRNASDDMADLLSAILALKAMPWFPKSRERCSRVQG